MNGITLHGAMELATSSFVGASLASLASWQVAGVAFGFVFAILIVGFLLERWVVGLHV